MIRRLAVILTLATLSEACSQQQKQQQDPTVVALVNGEPVLRVDFEQQLAREAQAMEGGARTPEQLAPYKTALLDTMVEHLLLLQAAHTANVTVSSEEVDRRVLALASEYPAGTFDEALAQSQTTRAALARQERERLTIEKLYQTQVFSRLAVTEDQIRRAFEAHADEYVDAEQVHAQQIVVKGLDEAKRIQQQLWQGKKFSDLARRYSLSPDGKVGGDLGWFPRGVMPPAFDDAVFKLSVGGTSDVVSTDFGFHIFKLLEKRPARKRDLNEMRGTIEQRLLAELRAEAQKKYVEELRAKATVKVNDETLAAVTSHSLGGQSAEP